MNINMQRYALAVVALFAYIYGFEFLVHGKMLANIYSQTPTVWRTMAEMTGHLPFNLFIVALLSLWITYIFTRFYSEGGVQNGIRFGFYIGILSGIQAAGAYFYLPVSGMLAVYWFIAYTIESVVGGLIIGAIYRR